MPALGAHLARVVDDRVEHPLAQAVGRPPSTGLGGKQRRAVGAAALAEVAAQDAFELGCQVDVAHAGRGLGVADVEAVVDQVRLRR
jgi:hypothetical protein